MRSCAVRQRGSGARDGTAALNLILLFDEDFDDEGSRRACDAGEEVTVELRGRRCEHVREVHRAAPGRELGIGRLGGRVGRGVVSAIDEERVALDVRLDADPPRKLPITLLLALPRPKSLRRVLQTVATMGVPRLLLLNSWRVEKSYWKSPALAPSAIREQLLLGLEQGRDTILPTVETKRLLVPFCRDELDALAAGTRRLVAHPPAAPASPRALAEPVTLALGPEGGFIAREIELLEAHGFEPVSLGPRPLRVEQAVPALLARLGP
jgi:RsmE family RNA methyltransferase